MRLIDADELIEQIEEQANSRDTTMYEPTVCDIENIINQSPTIDQWHYPSKGEVPPNGGDYLVCIEYEDREYIRVGQYFGETGWYTDLGEVYGYWTPIAWQYFVPPKEEA